MSVQSEINRIKGNVTAALAKIAEKGVTVPDGANSDNLAALIEAISAGGGMETIFNHKWEYGSFTPAEDITSNYTINFENNYAMPGSGYGYFIMFLDAINGTPNGSWMFAYVGRRETTIENACGQYMSTSGSVKNVSTISTVGLLSTTSIKINCTSSKMLRAGYKYNWIMIGAEKVE